MAMINEDSTYQLDSGTGNLIRATSKKGALGFRGFYEGRPELTGTHSYGHEWRVIDRPAIRPGVSGPMSLPYRSGRGFQKPAAEERDWGGDHEPADISGLSNLRPSPAAAVTTEQGALGPRSGYNLHNVSTVRQAEPWAIGAGRPAIGAQGALPRGSQFNGVGGAPRPFGELGPAGSSSITTKTETKGKRAGQMAWDF
jgi:hypothetical protein